MTSSIEALSTASRLALQEGRKPSSPRTPSRFISSNYSSPGSTYRQEEDAIIIELGSRYLRAGFEGDTGPQCVYAFGPEHSQRVGDYRFWARRKRTTAEEGANWASGYELWQNDLKYVDVGLVGDRLERAVREVYNQYLLTEAGTARLVLVLPSILPHPILSSVLTTLFERWKYPTITLLPSPAMATIAAGLRSALVVDIGWEETVMTAVYEYRQILTRRTTRAMKALVRETGKQLRVISREHSTTETPLPVDFDFTEEVMSRAAFCEIKTVDGRSSEDAEASEIEIEWPTGTSSEKIKVGLAALCHPVTSVFLGEKAAHTPLDDHEQTLPVLLYKALLGLDADSRAVCISRIVFVGGGSHIPGLRERVLAEVEELINTYGWTPVRGKKADIRRMRERELAQSKSDTPAARHDVALPVGEDKIEVAVRKQQGKSAQPGPRGEVRSLESLGSWVGASLLTSLKVKGFVEIEREKYLSHGLSGAHREVEVSVVPQRLSGFGIAASKSHERSSWTLASWG